MKKTAKVLAIVVVVGVVLYFFSWPVPDLIQNLVRFYLQKYFPFPVTVGQIRYQFPNRVVLEDLHLHTRNQPDIVSCRRAIVYIPFSKVRIISAHLNFSGSLVNFTGEWKFLKGRDWRAEFVARYQKQNIIFRAIRHYWGKKEESQFSLEIEFPRIALSPKNLLLTRGHLFYNSYGPEIFSGKVRLESDFLIGDNPVTFSLFGKLKSSPEDFLTDLTSQGNFLIFFKGQNVTGNFVFLDRQLKINIGQPFASDVLVDLKNWSFPVATVSLNNLDLSIVSSSFLGYLNTYIQAGGGVINSTYTLSGISGINLQGAIKYLSATEEFYFTGKAPKQFALEISARKNFFQGKLQTENYVKNFQGNYSFLDGLKISDFKFADELSGECFFPIAGGWQFSFRATNFDLTLLNFLRQQKLIERGKLTGTVSASKNEKTKISLETELTGLLLVNKNSPGIDARIKLSGDENEVNLFNASFLLFPEKDVKPAIVSCWGKATRQFDIWKLDFVGKFANLNFIESSLRGKWSFQGDFLASQPFPNIKGKFFLEPEIKNFGAISGKLFLSPRAVVFEWVNLNNWITTRRLSFSLPDGIIQSDFQVKEFPVGNFFQFSGLNLNPEATLSGSGKISGTVSFPEVSARLSNDNRWIVNSSFSVSGCQIDLKYDKEKIARVAIGISAPGYQSRINLRAGIDKRIIFLDSKTEISEVKEISSILFPAISLSGQLTLNLATTGYLDRPFAEWDLSGNVQSQKLTFWDFRFNNLNCNFSRKKNFYYFSGKTGSSYGDINVTFAEFSPAEKKLQLFGQLGNFRIFGFDLIGKVELTARMLHKNHFQGEVLTKNLWVNQHNFAAEKIFWKYQNQQLSIQSSPDSGGNLIALLDFSKNFCQINYQENNQKLVFQYQAETNQKNFQLRTEHLPVNYLTELSGISEEIDGELNSTLELIQTENIWRGAGDFTLSNARILGLEFADFSGQWQMQNNTLTVTKLLARQGKNYVLSGYGYLGITPEGKIQGPLDLTLKVEEGNLTFLKSIFPRIIQQAQGSVFASVHIRGNWPDISLTGNYRVVDGEISASSYFERMSKLNLSGRLENDTLTVDDSYARLGEGRLNLTGWLKLKGLSISEVDLNLKTIGSKGIPINIPELPIPQPLFRTARWKFLLNKSAGQPRLDLELKGKVTAPKISGKIILDNTHFTYPSLLTPSKSEPAQFLKNLEWDVYILSGDNTWYENELASVLINGQIHLSGVGTAPEVNGRIESTRGTIIYLNREFNVQSAVLDIVKSQCVLEGRAETTVTSGSGDQTDTVSLIIDKSPIEKISPRLVSRTNPDYSLEQIFRQMSGPDNSPAGISNYEFYLRQQLVRLVDSSLATPLAKNLLRSLGVADNVRVSYAGTTAAETTPSEKTTLLDLLKGTRYSLEKNVSDRLLLGYSITLDDLQSRLDLHHELELSYRWYKNIYLRGVYELGNISADGRKPERRLGIEHRYRFGWPEPNAESRKEQKELETQK